MFTLQIVDSDAFLDMPQSSQLLYFHLSMRADDDGFVGNPKKILRMIGTNDDDLKVLFTKRFILAFENGIVVIKHWRMHNYIQNDRYKETQYLEEKNKLEIKENGSYTERKQNVSNMDTQVRLGKVRLGKSKDKDTASQSDARIPVVINLFKEVNPSYSRLFGMPPQREAVERLLKTHGEEKLSSMIAFLPKSNATKFAPTITTPVQFEQRLGELVAWSQKQKESGKGRQIISSV